MNSFRCEDADMEVLTEDVDAENNNENCELHYNCFMKGNIIVVIT